MLGYALTRFILRKRWQSVEGGSLGPVPAGRDIHQAGISRPLGQRRGRLGLWLPSMRQEVSDEMVFVRGQALQHIFEMSVGVKSVESGALNQAHDRGRTLACLQGACEQPVLSPGRWRRKTSNAATNSGEPPRVRAQRFGNELWVSVEPNRVAGFQSTTPPSFWHGHPYFAALNSGGSSLPTPPRSY